MTNENTNNDLISREALKKALNFVYDCAYIDSKSKEGIVSDIIDIIDNAPTVEPEKMQGDSIAPKKEDCAKWIIHDRKNLMIRRLKKRGRNMSKNKIIKELHETTLISYKDCRATLKRCKWNFRAAYIKLYGGLDGNFILSLDAEKRAEIMNALNSAVNSITNAFKELQTATDSAVESASKFTAAVLAAYKENGGKI